MIRPPAAASLPHPGSKDAPKAHPDPGVQGREDTVVAVFVVFKPATKGLIHLHDDLPEATAGAPARLGSDRVLELLQALWSGAARAVLKAVAQKVKGFDLRIDDPRLGRVQRQTGFCRPGANRFPARCGSRSNIAHHRS